VHPDYMGTYPLSMGCMLDFLMSGRTPPQAAQYNTQGIYENLKWFSLPSGGLVYPNGQDWELYRDCEWTYLHILMAALGGDPDAWSLMQPCLVTQEKMQARSPSGRVYLDEEFFFPSTLSDLIYYDAMAWLALAYHGPMVDHFAGKRGVLRLDAGKIILNRTPSAIHSVSWGAQVMIQCMPFRLDRMTSPHARSGIGHIRLEGTKEDLPISLHVARVVNDAKGFEAALEVDHGGGKVRAFLNVRSAEDGTLLLSERLEALRELATAEVATGLIGVLNNPDWVYEHAKRTVTFDETAHVAPSGQGSEYEAEGAKRIEIDGILRIASEEPLHVLYRGAKKPERARFTDELYLNYLGKPRTWHAGEVISQYTVKIVAGTD
jgi:hypothetical protein